MCFSNSTISFISSWKTRFIEYFENIRLQLFSSNIYQAGSPFLSFIYVIDWGKLEVGGYVAKITELLQQFIRRSCRYGDGDQGVKVPIDLRGSLPVSKPRACLTLLPRSSVFLVISAYPLMPSPHACWMTMKQLQQPSIWPTQDRAQANTQYLMPLEKFSMALPVSPNLHSMQRGEKMVQQQASQQRQERPQASRACQVSMHMATLQAVEEKQQHWQHFFTKSLITNLLITRVDSYFWYIGSHPPLTFAQSIVIQLKKSYWFILRLVQLWFFFVLLIDICVHFIEDHILIHLLSNPLPPGTNLYIFFFKFQPKLQQKMKQLRLCLTFFALLSNIDRNLTGPWRIFSKNILKFTYSRFLQAPK